MIFEGVGVLEDLKLLLKFVLSNLLRIIEIGSDMS